MSPVPPQPRPPGSPDEPSGDDRPDLAGRTFGKFKIAERVGSGAMGTVYRALQMGMNRVVALKVLLPETTTDPQAVQRFVREAQSAGRLNHPNIIQVYDVGQVETYYYLAMEYVDGPNLEDLLEERGSLPPLEALDIVIACAEALDHAAGEGVVHRDIKPANVMLNARGVVKLADLGIAKMAPSDLQKGDSSGVLTMEGAIMGSPFYMSPEQAMNSAGVDARTDIYSLGATFYHMIHGRVAFPAETSMDAISRLLDEEPEFPNPTPEHAAVEPVLRTMMAKEREDRPGSALALLDDLRRVRNELAADQPDMTASSRLRKISGERKVPEELLKEHETTGEGPSKTRSRRPPPRRRSSSAPVAILLTLLVVAAGGAVAWHVSTRTDGPASAPGATDGADADPAADGGEAADEDGPAADLAAARALREEGSAEPDEVFGRFRELAAGEGAVASEAREDLTALAEEARTTIADRVEEAREALREGDPGSADEALASLEAWEGVEEVAGALEEAVPVREALEACEEHRPRIREAGRLAGTGSFDRAGAILDEVEGTVPPLAAEALGLAEARAELRTAREEAEAREELLASIREDQATIFRLLRAGEIDRARAEARALDNRLSSASTRLDPPADPLEDDVDRIRDLVRQARNGLEERSGSTVRLRPGPERAPLEGVLRARYPGFDLDRNGERVSFYADQLPADELLRWATEGGADPTPLDRLVARVYRGEIEEAADLLEARSVGARDRELWSRKLAMFRRVAREDRRARAREDIAEAVEEGDGAWEADELAEARRAYLEAVRTASAHDVSLEERARIEERLDAIAEETGDPWRASDWGPLFSVPVRAWSAADREIEVRYAFDGPGALEDWRTEPLLGEGNHPRAFLDYLFRPVWAPGLPSDLTGTDPWRTTEVDGRTVLVGRGWDRLVWRGWLVREARVTVRFRARTDAGPLVTYGLHPRDMTAYYFAAGLSLPPFGPDLQRGAPDLAPAYRRLDRLHGGILEGWLFPRWDVRASRDLRPTPGEWETVVAEVDLSREGASLRLALDGTGVQDVDPTRPVVRGTVALAAPGAILEIAEVRIRGRIDEEWAEQELELLEER